MVLFLCSCGFLDAVSWARCLFAHPFICSFIPSFIIICVLSTCCADAVLISGEREKSMTGTAPTSWILQALAASPQRTDQAIAALRATLVAQSVKGLQMVRLVTSLLLRGDTSPPSPSSSTLVWVGSFLLLPVTPGKCRVWGVEICVGTLPLWALVSDLLSGPLLPCSPPS